MSSDPIGPVLHWYCAPDSSSTQVPGEVSLTRDVFQARLDTLYQEITVRQLLPEDDTALLTSVAGEIGNNCFDHNLGQWSDQIGCWFSWATDAEEVWCLIADRGQGVLNSLKRVQPDLQDELQALKIAFEKRLSGRSPEQRGNGLKFVRIIINQHSDRGLLFCSGPASIRFGGNRQFEKYLRPDKIKKQGTGTLAVLLWSRK